jgi:hypothetical protein
MPRIEENVEITDRSLDTIAYLEDVLEKLDAGEERFILADPFYQRADGKPPFSDEHIDRIIAAIDEEFATEMGQYAGYHRNRSGATATPDFHRLSPPARRAVVEGLDVIHRRHDELSKAQAVAAGGN